MVILRILIHESHVFSRRIFDATVFRRYFSRLSLERCEIKHYRGKEDLISSLEKTIPTLSKRVDFIIIVIDQDKQDCLQLKEKLKSKMSKCQCKYKIRIACYELESWFLGDMNAITQCSSRFKKDFFQNKQKYHQVDGIIKPSKVIEEIIPDWKEKYDSKPKFAKEMARHVCLTSNNNQAQDEINRSHSFHIFLKTLHVIKNKQ